MPRPSTHKQTQANLTMDDLFYRLIQNVNLGYGLQLTLSALAWQAQMATFHSSSQPSLLAHIQKHPPTVGSVARRNGLPHQLQGTLPVPGCVTRSPSWGIHDRACPFRRHALRSPAVTAPSHLQLPEQTLRLALG